VTGVPARSERSGTLASQMVGGTLAIVTVAVLVAAVLALAGVYRMVESETDARLVAYRQIILDGIAARLSAVDRVVVSVATAVSVRPEDAEAMRTTVVKASGANVESIDLMLVVDPDGRVLAASLPSQAPSHVDTSALLARHSRSSQSIVTWQRSKARAAEGRLWVAQRFGQQGRLLAARLRPAFAQRLLDEIASRGDGRAAVLVDASDSVVASGTGGPALTLDRARLRPEEGRDRGWVDALSSPTAGPMTGACGAATTSPSVTRGSRSSTSARWGISQ
jgi:hypothetical protein